MRWSPNLQEKDIKPKLHAITKRRMSSYRPVYELFLTFSDCSIKADALDKPNLNQQ